MEDMAAGSDAMSRRARRHPWLGQRGLRRRRSRRSQAQYEYRDATIREFEARRLASLAATQPGSPRRTRKPAPIPARSGAGQPDHGGELCREYDVDMKHGTHVAELAHQLLALTMPLHHLDEHYLDVIYVAGCCTISRIPSTQEHHTRGRDIVLTTRCRT